MKCYICDREAGNIIDEVSSIEEGWELIKAYEKADKEDGTYEDDFYDVVDEDRISLPDTTIRYLRDKLGMTRDEFAKEFNIPKRTIENWESKTNKPPVYVMNLLEEVINNRYKI